MGAQTPDHPVDSPQGQPDPRTDPSYGQGPLDQCPPWMAVLQYGPGTIVELYRPGSWSGVYIFRIEQVREPTHPQAQGIVWEGFYWRWHDLAGQQPSWGPRTVLHLWPDKLHGLAGPISPDTRYTFGVPDPDDPVR